MNYKIVIFIKAAKIQFYLKYKIFVYFLMQELC